MVQMKQVSYAGVDGCLSLSNGKVELIVTVEFGPRVLFFGKPGGENLFRIFEDQIVERPHDEWQSYGGHRLWHAPEVVPRTYYPDHDPVEYSWDGTTLRLFCFEEKGNQLRKEIDITLDAESTTVDLTHRIYNTGAWSAEYAVWALSVMAPGGEAIIPQEEFIGHPEALYPARPLVLWHFTRMNDPRFTWGDRYIRLREDSRYESKQKIGLRSRPGWAAYRLHDELFIKLHDHDEDALYPDMGCNAEFFTMPGFLEMETLSPLVNVGPGEAISHRERWGLYGNFEGNEENDIREHIFPKVEMLEKGFKRSES